MTKQLLPRIQSLIVTHCDTIEVMYTFLFYNILVEFTLYSL